MSATAEVVAGEVARVASNSAAEITPLSRNSTARRSRCSAGDALVTIARASSAVSTPFVTRMRTSGSLELSACAKADGIIRTAIRQVRIRHKTVRMSPPYSMIHKHSACQSFSHPITPVQIAFPLINNAFSLILATALTFQIFKRIASSYISIPGRMMGPGPRARDGAISHRAKRTRLGGCSFVDVNYESRQHQQRCEVMNYITDGNAPAGNDVIKPQQ